MRSLCHLSAHHLDRGCCALRQSIGQLVHRGSIAGAATLLLAERASKRIAAAECAAIDTAVRLFDRRSRCSRLTPSLLLRLSKNRRSLLVAGAQALR